MSDLFKIVLSAALVALNGFFVSAEFAMIRVRRTRMEELADAGSASSKAVLKALERLDTFLAATQLGITMANLGLGWVGEPVMQRILQPIFDKLHIVSADAAATLSLIVAFVIITFVEVVFGELLPKWRVIQNPERVASLVVYPMIGFYRLFSPAVLLLNWSAGIFARIIGIDPATVGSTETAHSEEEIIAIVEQAEQSGTIGPSEAQIVDKAFEFAHTQVKEVMVPRVDIVALSTAQTLSEVMETAGTRGFTRYPVCVDDRDHIIGMVHIKDLVGLSSHPDSDIESVMRPISAVPETKRIDVLLREMQRSGSHMALVLDEYGGTAGIVTMEDVLEELVGEIQDEYDQPPPVEHLDENCVTIAGTEPIGTATEVLGLALPGSEDYQTLGGYARHVLGLTAAKGARTRLGDYTVEVEEAKGQRISRLLFRRAEDQDARAAEGDPAATS